MNDAPTLDHLDELDDFEQVIVRTLRAKADQLEVDDRPFDTEARPVAALVRSRSTRPDRRRVLAVAATVAILGGAVVAAQRLGPGDGGDGGDSPRPDAVAAAPLYTTLDPGPAAFVPATVPEGWTLAQVDTGHFFVEPEEARPTTWQLFAADGPSPLARGLLVGSTPTDQDALEVYATDGELHTVREGEPHVTPSPRPEAPAGTLEAVWIDGDVLHEAVAVGMSEAELRQRLEGLVPHDDPTTGFAAPAAGGLPLLDTSVVDGQYLASLIYVGPAWDDDAVDQGADTVVVEAAHPDANGGLLHRLLGEPEGDELVLRGSEPPSGEIEGYSHVSLLRADGWALSVSAAASPTVGADPAILDAFLDSLRPVTREELIELAAAEPVTASGIAGGWSVDVHGNRATDVSVCLTPDDGRESCTTAENQIDPVLSTGSALVGDQWVVAVVGDDTADVTVGAARPGGEGPPSATEDGVPGERGQLDDGRVVELFPIPADVDSVAVETPTDDGWTMHARYDRPPG